jgi:xanthine dehydrogenase accessory factor
MNTEWITAAARLQAQQQAFALVSVLRVQPPASAKAGDKALVTADGAIHGWIGGGCAQPAVIKTVRQALQDGQPRTIRITPTDTTEERTLGDVLEFGMACHSGGTLELFIDPVLPAAQLTVVGDSPLARALVELAPRVGFDVSVVAEGASAEHFPEARRVLGSDAPAQVSTVLAAGGFVVVATQGRRDLQGLKAALALQPRGLWFVASARKAGVLKETLLAGGEDAAKVAAIRAPAGQPIGAQTAEEIALTVLVAVVAARRAPGPALGTSDTFNASGTSSAAARLDSTAQADPASTLEMAQLSDGPGTPISEALGAAPAPAKSCCGGAARKVAAPAWAEASASAAGLSATPVAEAGPSPRLKAAAPAAPAAEAPASGTGAAPQKSCCAG